jgi:hypothetical protein
VKCRWRGSEGTGALRGPASPPGRGAAGPLAGEGMASRGWAPGPLSKSPPPSVVAATSEGAPSAPKHVPVSIFGKQLSTGLITVRIPSASAPAADWKPKAFRPRTTAPSARRYCLLAVVTGIFFLGLGLGLGLGAHRPSSIVAAPPTAPTPSPSIAPTASVTPAPTPSASSLPTLSTFPVQNRVIGVNEEVSALTTVNGSLFMGGSFTTLGDGTTVANGVASWDGTTWTTLQSGSGNGVGGIVYALASFNGLLFVGGDFTTLGDGATTANHVASWDGTTWTTLQSGSRNGVGGPVHALASFNGLLFVGGSFVTLGDGATAADHVASWDGTTFSPGVSGRRLTGAVSSLTVFENRLVVGGAFTTLASPVGEAIPANFLASLVS